MIAVIFEVTPTSQGAERYFELAGQLREELAKIDGFISVERFASLTTPDKYVSLSFWRDEAAVKTWREHAGHAAAQAEGKDGLFADYRIRIAEVTRDYSI